MRHPSPRMYPNDVTVLPLARGPQDAGGGRIRSWPSEGGISLRASVQPASSSRRGEYQGATRSEADAVAFFAVDPGVKLDWHLLWHVTPTLTRTYEILGPASPQGGGTAAVSVSLKEIA